MRKIKVRVGPFYQRKTNIAIDREEKQGTFLETDISVIHRSNLNVSSSIIRQWKNQTKENMTCDLNYHGSENVDDEVVKFYPII